jgi:hypothetical protein
MPADPVPAPDAASPQHFYGSTADAVGAAGSVAYIAHTVQSARVRPAAIPLRTEASEMNHFTRRHVYFT